MLLNRGCCFLSHKLKRLQELNQFSLIEIVRQDDVHLAQRVSQLSKLGFLKVCNIVPSVVYFAIVLVFLGVAPIVLLRRDKLIRLQRRQAVRKLTLPHGVGTVSR